MGRRRWRRDPLDSARQILAERYARDDLSADEYRKRLDELARVALTSGEGRPRARPSPGSRIAAHAFLALTVRGTLHLPTNASLPLNDFVAAA